uniref:hypothetical protein n=1 Tax=Elmerina hispida TaxID=1245649 RepID=UPI00300178FD|nr:hypothetical protein [Elmerina hispida]
MGLSPFELGHINKFNPSSFSSTYISKNKFKLKKVFKGRFVLIYQKFFDKDKTYLLLKQKKYSNHAIKRSDSWGYKEVVSLDLYNNLQGRIHKNPLEAKMDILNLLDSHPSENLKDRYFVSYYLNKKKKNNYKPKLFKNRFFLLWRGEYNPEQLPLYILEKFKLYNATLDNNKEKLALDMLPALQKKENKQQQEIPVNSRVVGKDNTSFVEISRKHEGSGLKKLLYEKVVSLDMHNNLEARIHDDHTKARSDILELLSEKELKKRDSAFIHSYIIPGYRNKNKPLIFRKRFQFLFLSVYDPNNLPDYVIKNYENYKDSLNSLKKNKELAGFRELKDTESMRVVSIDLLDNFKARTHLNSEKARSDILELLSLPTGSMLATDSLLALASQEAKEAEQSSGKYTTLEKENLALQNKPQVKKTVNKENSLFVSKNINPTTQNNFKPSLFRKRFHFLWEPDYNPDNLPGYILESYNKLFKFSDKVKKK